MGHVNGPVRLVLTLELTATAEPIAGLAGSGGQPGLAFSGWSELFAVLQTLISQAGSDANAQDHRASGRHAEHKGPGRPALRQEDPSCRGTTRS
jgi:hypothetical protein